MRFLVGCRPGRRKRPGRRLAAGEDVKDALEGRALPDRQIERHAGDADGFPDGGDNGIEVDVFAVHLVDDDHAGAAGLAGGIPGLDGVELHAVDG